MLLNISEETDFSGLFDEMVSKKQIYLKKIYILQQCKNACLLNKSINLFKKVLLMQTFKQCMT